MMMVLQLLNRVVGRVVLVAGSVSGSFSVGVGVRLLL